jgi:hypothetical protein
VVKCRRGQIHAYDAGAACVIFIVKIFLDGNGD